MKSRRMSDYRLEKIARNNRHFPGKGRKAKQRRARVYRDKVLEVAQESFGDRSDKEERKRSGRDTYIKHLETDRRKQKERELKEKRKAEKMRKKIEFEKKQLPQKEVGETIIYLGAGAYYDRMESMLEAKVGMSSS